MAWVYDGRTKRGYVNGEMRTSTEVDVAVDRDHDVIIGADERGTLVENYYEGAIDEVRIYSRALSPAEIQELFVNVE